MRAIRCGRTRSIVAFIMLCWLLLPGVARADLLSVATKDGLQLVVGREGRVRAVRDGGRLLPETGHPGGFSLRTAGGNRNLLPNPGFERDRDRDRRPDGWTFTGAASSPVVDRAVSHSGKRALRLSASSLAASGAFWTETQVSPATSYFFCGWFKSRRIKPRAPTAYSPSHLSPVRIKVQQISGGSQLVETSNAYGYTGTAGWHKQCVGFRTHNDVARIRVLGQIVGGKGKVWYDDLYLGRLLGRHLSVNGEVEPVPGGALRQRDELPAHGVALEAVFSGRSDHIRVDGSIEGIGRGDRSVEVTYTLPIDARGWRWGNYARDSQEIDSGTYANETLWNVQPTSRYPFGSIHDDRSLLGVGVPLSDPRVTRIEYKTGKGLSISFDLGVARGGSSAGPKATFSFVIYTGDAEWGFRSATARYYDIFPQSFVHRTDPAREGIWFQKPPLDQLSESYRDFGLGLNMVALGDDTDQSHSTWGTTYLPWDNERGIYGSAYNHHWVYRGEVGPEKLPSYKKEIESIKDVASSSPDNHEERRNRDEAVGALRSTAKDINGRFLYEIYRRIPSFYESLDRLPQRPGGMDWESAVLEYQVEHALDLAAGAGARLDGIHLDSTSGMRRWAASDNYNRKHWPFAQTPLTFSYDSAEVTERLIFPIYDHIRRLSRNLHRKGMILTANFNASEARAGGWIGADRIDYFGIERSLTNKTSGDPFVSVDSFAMLKRTLAYQRPISTLDAVEDGQVTLSQLEERLKLNLFYGIFSGVGGEGTWDEDRAELYGKYTPIFRALVSAGWEPVTYARSSNESVWLERYGDASTGDLHLALRNHSNTIQSYAVTLEPGPEGHCPVSSAQGEELVSGTPVPIVVGPEGDEATFTGEIDPKETQVVAIDLIFASSC